MLLKFIGIIGRRSALEMPAMERVTSDKTSDMIPAVQTTTGNQAWNPAWRTKVKMHTGL